MRQEPENPVSLAELTDDLIPTVARWLSNPATNRWLYSQWRGRKVDETLLRALMLSPRNVLRVIRLYGCPYGLVGLDALDAVDRSALLWAVRGDTCDVRACLVHQWPHPPLPILEEAVRQYMVFAFADLAVHSVSASTMAHNTRVMRILERVGFRHVGVMREALPWSAATSSTGASRTSLTPAPNRRIREPTDPVPRSGASCRSIHEYVDPANGCDRSVWIEPREAGERGTC